MYKQLGLVGTALEKFEVEFKNAKIIGYFLFGFKEN